MASRKRKTKLSQRYGRAARPVRSGIQALADETAPAVISQAMREAIAGITEDFMRDMHKDPAYRAEIKREALTAAREVVKSFRAARGAEH